MRISPAKMITVLQTESAKPVLTFLMYNLSRLCCIKDQLCPTMAVVGDIYGNYALHYNPVFWEAQTTESATMVLAHEALHFVLMHVYRVLLITRSSAFRHEHLDLLLLAAELACNNELCKILPIQNSLVTPRALALPPDQSLEEYFRLLLKKREKPTVKQLGSFSFSLLRTIEKMTKQQKEQENNETNINSADENSTDKNNTNKSIDHTKSNEDTERNMASADTTNTTDDNNTTDGININDTTTTAESDPEIMQQEQLKELKEALKKFNINNYSINTAKINAEIEIAKIAKNWGSGTNSIESLCKHVLPKKIPFTQYMRQIIGTQLTAKSRSLLRSARRRTHLTLQFPGKKAQKNLLIVWITDTSGSMNKEIIGRGLGLLRQLRNEHQHIVWVIEADETVQKMYELDTENKIEYNVVGRGGTNFDPALQAAGRLGADIVFYYTDGYAPTPTVKLSCPVHFIIAPNGTRVGNYHNILVEET